MIEILQIPFMQRAFIAGVILALLLAVLGVFVVLRRMAFFSDGIAHASLAGVSLAILTSFAPIVGALVAAVVFAVLIFFVEKKLKVTSDSAIGIIFTTGLSIGVILMSITPGYQPELITFLFGNILAITKSDLVLISSLSTVILLFIFAFRKKLTLFSLNEDLAKTSGFNTDLIQLMLYVILSVAVVLSIKVLGIILVSALLIVPVASGRLFAGSFKGLVWSGIIISEVVVITGITLSYLLDWPTGPTIVVAGTSLFGFLGILKVLKRV